ncbi:hypothetical protein [Legionella worsleiensis]|uniref:Transmembrane protein n=1 Tax=Legionella worsleiensis TaxID=45076 RepID=A0A0W1A6H1_9GAMM|nr:hypothetical protein [Legionella worsleiensis]KTD76922.1 hypothetical protein Lwor_2147 [Legionella worsleiensis]STY33408.1 Uncharacterised protein [Legionella worsleiensis]
MTLARKINTASSCFFLIGFLIAKSQYLPFVLTPIIHNILALSCYFIAYTLWFVSSHYQGSNTPDKREWYGFAQFKEQFLYAATLGIIASFIGILALFLPALIVPSTWLIFSCNVLWSVGEYNKLKHPSDDDLNFSYSNQQADLSYALTMSGIACTSALSATLLFFLPSITMPVFIISALIIAGLGLLSCECLLNSFFGEHKKTPTSKSSYNLMHTSLEFASPQQKIKLDQPVYSQLLQKPPLVMVKNDEINTAGLTLQSCTPSR